MKYYSVKDASKILGIKVRTVREWIRDGKIKAIKYPDCSWWFISQEEILRITGGVKDDNES